MLLVTINQEKTMFLKLTQSHKRGSTVEGPVFVNMDKVTVLQPKRIKGTRVYFGNDLATLYVEENSDEIINKMEQAKK